MKEGWTYKKLGEVCIDFIVPQRDKPTAFDGNIPWCRIEDIEGRYLNRSKSGQNVTKELADKMNMHICPKGTVISACSASIGNQAITTIDCYTNQTFIGLVVNPVLLNNVYLYYFLSSKTNDLQKMGQGVTIKYISKNEYKKMLIPLPSIENQQRIVAELDLLSGVIEKQKAQLEELDKLSQSIFYDMFGDPVTNEKGWDVIQLGDKCEVTSFKRVLIDEVVDEGVPFIRGTELTALSKMTNSESYDFSLFITPEHYERVKAISGVPSVGDLLIPSINADGNIWILDTSKPRYYKDGRVLWVHVNHDAYTSSALKFIMQVLLKDTYSDMASGATFAELKLFVLRELKIILPPLSLQQEFAAKVEAIEAMKAKVRQSLKESETLFNSRMDYYFN